MLLDNLEAFCERDVRYREKFSSYIRSKNLDKNERNSVLESLCRFLMKPACAGDVAECFPHYLPILLSRAIRTDPSEQRITIESENLHRLNCVVLGNLIDVNPDVLGFVLRYFEVNPAPFSSPVENLAVVTKKRRTDDVVGSTRKVTNLEIVTASYRILEAAPEHFKRRWNWSEFYNFLNDENDAVKWIAVKCIGIILRMSESTRLSCARIFIKNIENFLATREDNVSSTTMIESSDEDFTEVAEDVANSLVSIAGVLLPIFKNIPKTSLNMIPVPSTLSNLRSLGLAVASRKAVCLQGPVGSGKTALVEYLADVTGHRDGNFIKVQLGDQTDSKMLLGSYRCTDIPGEFIWQPGCLTHAVTNGKWLLLEDIDSAALDVASVLGNLMETGSLSVPGYRDTIRAKSGFQLFLTQRLISSVSGLHRRSIGASSLLEKNWSSIHVEPMSRQELVIVVEKLFPALRTISTRIVNVFLLFSTIRTDNIVDYSMNIGRSTSTRDLMKWCTRAIVDYQVSSPDSALKIFQDAIDIFCCSVPDPSHRLELAIAIGHTLGIVRTKAEYYCKNHKPSMNITTDYFVAGRAKLARKKSSRALIDERRIKFSFTRQTSNLLERIASSIAQREPVLLVGETGTGKTSSIQYLARITGHKLIVINMNQQSESADLLGGYKPVDFKYLVSPIRQDFEILFRSYFALEPNKKFLDHIAVSYRDNRWKTLVGLMRHSATSAVKRLRASIDVTGSRGGTMEKHDETKKFEMLKKWEKILAKLEKLKTQVRTHYSLAFAFIEGSLIKALKEGHWILLDEINLASSETLECLSGLLEGTRGSLSLLELGDVEMITRHPDFTIFACMNPATDVGKKELPIGLRNRFTEFYIDELVEKNDLQLLVGSYLEDANLPNDRIESIVRMYLKLRKESTLTLSDGTGHKPHYSLRTLCRALSVASINPCGNITRSLYESFSMSFLTQLDHLSYPIVQETITRAMIDPKMAKSILGVPIPKPRCNNHVDYTCFEGYWITKGKLEPRASDDYVLTKTVRRNLRDLARIVSIGKMPVLLQGDTSVGKTSLITYLARASGHNCVRINNHEHTDLQEYVGNYVADDNGKLIFKEGVLIEAMRQGHWIILDELNLAPSDVLEALNRVLDDNREIFITETQITIKAHDNFMLFATQNPPGIYGGRKALSRAFRNRFVELHFDEIPSDELLTIMHERCHMPESYCRRIIAVMNELQLRRKSTATFQGKHGFITLRDLFRWGERYRLADVKGDALYDWSQHLADEGYLVLAAKVRKSEEAREIREVIRKHLKRDVDPSTLFDLNDKTSSVTRKILENIVDRRVTSFDHIVWTRHMRRMAVLVGKSCQFNEPILLVGDTGGGKTTICQLIASINRQTLYTVNCHMHTESSDFLGNLRPVREHNDDNDKLFEWRDGPLISAMKNGDLFLADEISLADDSVLERLNSLLEPERSLLLTERGVDSADPSESDCVITANEKFLFIGTMNPGGDYGKKELSPALRNRFTEIWCEGCIERSDLQEIVEHNLNSRICDKGREISTLMLDFVDWLRKSEIGKRFTVSIRDIMTWVHFINSCIDDEQSSRLSLGDAYLHGACLTYIDSLGSGLTGMESAEKLEVFRNGALEYLKSQINNNEALSVLPTFDETSVRRNEKIDENSSNLFGIETFFIAKGPKASDTDDLTFTFTAPTTRSNTLKILRSLQLKKPLLLEGSPGVGKTSLIAAIARASGHPLLRINLSDQTDVSDLFGADLPVEGGKAGEFAWKDGPFLRALRAGDWILLDELNLASQSVLEGLNACLDHRGEIYVPELGRKFTIKPATKLFACQNPLRQGGARRGLPKSFLNRFTQVYVDALNDDDLRLIMVKLFPEITEDTLNKMVKFNGILSREAGSTSWAHNGSPWEMNLRDITRWCEAIVASSSSDIDDRASYNPGNGVELIYVDRMRTQDDRRRVREIYEDIFDIEMYPLMARQPIVRVTEEHVFLGDVILNREELSNGNEHDLLILRDQIGVLRSLGRCVRMNWMPILVGGPGCGKSSVVRALAQLTGQRLRSIVVNSAMDTTEILGGFEQTDYNRHLEQLMEQVENLLMNHVKMRLNADFLDEIVEYHGWLERVENLAHDETSTITMSAETELFLRRTNELWKLVSAMKNLENLPSTELREIEEKLRKLAVNVKQDKCLNAGGKFEWIDSILVKCLQEGSWLLLDQVNLCSPAVLDRLNGLLEPGGVLTIGERGVADDGDITTIKPHKNFRLFMTMDPRYGEISRAMRNRGVEIYMLDQNENCYNDSSLDLRSLLHNIGLVRRNYQDALLDLDEKMSRENVTSEKLCLGQILNAAFLMTQQMTRGFLPIEAFRSACIDVYVKSRYVQQSLTKNHLENLIDRTIDHHDLSRASETFFDLTAATLKIRDLLDNSSLTIIRHQGFILDGALRIHESSMKKYGTDNEARQLYPGSSFINDFLSVPKNHRRLDDLDIVKLLPHLLLNFYEHSSIRDAKLRQLWLEKNFPIGNDEILRKIVETSGNLAAEISKSGRNFFNDKLPWDTANLPNIPNHDNNVGRANRLALNLYLIAMDIQYSGILDDSSLDKNEKTITVVQYSSSVYHGKLTSHLKNQPLITNFVIFIAQLTTCVNMIFHENSTLLGNEDYIDHRRNLAWLVRFHSLGKLPLIDKTEKTSNLCANLDEVVPMLRVHYKWLVKFVNSLTKLVVDKDDTSDECKIEISRLKTMIDCIDDSVTSIDDPFRKITKGIKKYLTMPLPFSGENVTRIYEKLKKLSEEFSPCAIDREEVTTKRELRIILLQKEESLKMRDELLKNWRNFYNDKNDEDSTLRSLCEMEEFSINCNIAMRTPLEISRALDCVKNNRERDMIDLSSKVQLWPIYEYTFYILANNLHRRIQEDRDIGIMDGDGLTELSKIPSLPIDLVALLLTMMDIEIGTKRDRLKPVVFAALDNFTRNSCAFDVSSIMINWQGTNEDNNVETSLPENRERTRANDPVDSPVLLKLVCQLIINDDAQSVEERSILSTARLGNYRSRLRQLKLLNRVLWCNSVCLNSPDYDVTKNETLTLLSCAKDFLEAENKMSANDGGADVILQREIAKQKSSARRETEEKFRRDYVEPLEELRTKYRAIISSLESADNDRVLISKSWIILGYLRVFLFANLGHIDPINKIRLKLRYIEDDIEDCRTTIYTNLLNSRINGDSFPSVNTHPRAIETCRCLEIMQKERNDLEACKAVRPSSIKFVVLAKETLNFRNTLGSWEIVAKLTNKLSTSIDELTINGRVDEKCLSVAEDGIHEAEIWRESLHRFTKLLNDKYSKGYPDIVIPILEAVAQLRRGIGGLCKVAGRLLNIRRTSANDLNIIDNLVENLVRFPTIGKTQTSLLNLVEICTSRVTREIISSSTKNEEEKDDALIVTLTEQFRMTKIGLIELGNHTSLVGKLDFFLWHELNVILQQIVLLWQRQRDEIAKIEIEKDSFYKNKVKIAGDSPNENEEITRELRDLFPTWRDKDFTDIDYGDVPTLEPVDVNVKEQQSDDRRYAGLVTDDDIHQVHTIHSRIVKSFVRTPWMKKRTFVNERDYVQPLIQRYNTFALMLKQLLPSMDERASNKLYASMNFITSVCIRTSEGTTRDDDSADKMIENSSMMKNYDYYKSSNVDEAKQCLSLLEMIDDRVDDFQKEWPEHPTLRSMRSIVRRINGFSITSPLSRFLTGLELLLTKMKEWEENAHSGVSLSEYSFSLTDQIISWRKLELGCWKDCLNASHERLKARASKWWFFLYALIESYMTKSTLNSDIPDCNVDREILKIDEQPVSATKFTELLEAFLSGSSLVEFQPRLDLLLTFHAHAYHFMESQERRELLSILWNVHNYYDQFSADVERRIKTLREPIEKKLCDFVKIAKWNDINYWSIRETVDKTHRTLHKFIRDYESGICTSVAACLVVEPTNYSADADKGEWDRSKIRDYSIDPGNFVCSAKIMDESTNVGGHEKPELISRMKNFFNRAKRLCRETILMSSYPGLRVGIENLIEDTLLQSNRLKNMEIDRTLPRPKQKSHAKSILQLKKMALSDYFKTLSHIGLSYRTGLLAWKNRPTDVIDLRVPPVDLTVSFDNFHREIIDEHTLAQWEGCENYYYKSLVKLTALNAAFNAKHRSDLGQPNMERCSGYSNHTMLIAHEQKRIIARSFDSYVSLRNHSADFSKINDYKINAFGHRDTHDCAQSLKKLTVTLETCFEQLSLYMRACPADSGLETNVDIFILESSKLPIINAMRNDPVWENAVSLLKNCLDSLNPISLSYDKLFHVDLVIVTPRHYEFLNTSNEILRNLKIRIREFANIFTNEKERSHPIMETIEFMISRIDEWMEKFVLIETTHIDDSATLNDNDGTGLKFTSNVELLLKTMLLAIQHKYKDTTADSVELETCETDDKVEKPEVENENDHDDDVDDVDVNDDDKMEKNSFREKLIESLEKDIDDLNLPKVQRCFVNLLQMTQIDDSSLALKRRSLLVRCLPLLKQYLLFSQFYLNEQVGAFRATVKLLNLQLNVFLDLARNGFCVPKDLDLEDGEDERSKNGKTQNGMGLGDGEGEKDVSDRIESEDQLDEARPADRESDKRDNEDCKEEENGIEMSEDFDANLQDVERKNDDDENDEKEDESEDENDDDLEKQMGETQAGADALDEEIWADDEENDSTNENEDEKPEENRGKGEEIGEREMTAKDDRGKDNENEKNENGDRKEKEQKEINEINDPETNDDQIDPYHGNQEPPPEPEPMDLPDDINLDGEEPNEDDAANEDNPFDIDEMKDCQPPMEKEEEKTLDDEKQQDEKKEEEPDYSSDEEDNEPEEGNETVANEDVDENEDKDTEKDSKTRIPEKKDDDAEDIEDEADSGDENKACASVDDPTKETDATDQSDVNKDGTRDKMADLTENNEESTAENNEDDSNNRGTGNARSEQREKGHSGDNTMENRAPVQRRDNEKRQIDKRKNPGESDDNRSLVDKIQPEKKKLKMIHSREENTRENDDEGAEKNDDEDADDAETDVCQHVKLSEKYDDEAMDAATEEQVKQQAANKETDQEKKIEDEDSMDVEMHVDEDEDEELLVNEETEKRIEEDSDNLPNSGKDKDRGNKKNVKGNIEDVEDVERLVETEGETCETVRVERGCETEFFTNIRESIVTQSSSSSYEVAKKRLEIETMLGRWTNVPTSDEALAAWNCLNGVVEAPARDLAEKLRLVLEPTQATRLKGDYRTGRRINMRKIIPYIASEFRKDKIWLRRTKPSKRDYKIVLALDDSSSMADNRSKELAFESLSLISKAMNYLEVGDLSVINFGETTNVLHPLGEPFTENSGSRLIQEMRFDQKKTKVGQLVDFTVDMFDGEKSSTDSAKLLVVLSDGRGVFSEGLDQVNSAVRRARLADIFLVFIIVDNPLNKDSILDIRMPVFQAGKLLGIKSYMDNFPFPFYMILRDINALPGVLSDALRQWFEIVGKIDT